MSMRTPLLPADVRAQPPPHPRPHPHAHARPGPAEAFAAFEAFEAWAAAALARLLRRLEGTPDGDGGGGGGKGAEDAAAADNDAAAAAAADICAAALLLLEESTVSAASAGEAVGPEQRVREYFAELLGDTRPVRSFAEQFVLRRAEVLASAAGAAARADAALPPNTVVYVKRPGVLAEERMLGVLGSATGAAARAKPSRRQRRVASTAAAAAAAAEGAAAAAAARRPRPLAAFAPGSVPLCDCEAREHPLVRNCPACGKIICELELAPGCPFCGTPPPGEEGEEAGGGAALQDAIAKKEDILRRAHLSMHSVLDDQADHFTTGEARWLAPEERERRLLEQERAERARENARRRNRVTFDFAGRVVLVAAEAAAEGGAASPDGRGSASPPDPAAFSSPSSSASLRQGQQRQSTPASAATARPSSPPAPRPTPAPSDHGRPLVLLPAQPDPSLPRVRARQRPRDQPDSAAAAAAREPPAPTRRVQHALAVDVLDLDLKTPAGQRQPPFVPVRGVAILGSLPWAACAQFLSRLAAGSFAPNCFLRFFCSEAHPPPDADGSSGGGGGGGGGGGDEEMSAFVNLCGRHGIESNCACPVGVAERLPLDGPVSLPGTVSCVLTDADAASPDALAAWQERVVNLSARLDGRVRTAALFRIADAADTLEILGDCDAHLPAGMCFVLDVAARGALSYCGADVVSQIRAACARHARPLVLIDRFVKQRACWWPVSYAPISAAIGPLLHGVVIAVEAHAAGPASPSLDWALPAVHTALEFLARPGAYFGERSLKAALVKFLFADERVASDVLELLPFFEFLAPRGGAEAVPDVPPPRWTPEAAQRVQRLAQDPAVARGALLPALDLLRLLDRMVACRRELVLHRRDRARARASQHELDCIQQKIESMLAE